MIEKTCEYCGKSFQVVNSRKDKARFCSYSCRSKKLIGVGEGSRFWNGGQPHYKCIVCGKEGTRRASTNSTYEFCSTKCHNIYRKKDIKITCKSCGKEFLQRPSKSDHKFCSWICYIKFAVRENSHNWKGGERGRKFYPKEWSKEFKNAIRERDNNTCAICGKFGDNVHHINYVKMDTTPENCVTLCRSCHAKTNSNRDYWVKYFSSY